MVFAAVHICCSRACAPGHRRLHGLNLEGPVIVRTRYESSGFDKQTNTGWKRCHLAIVYLIACSAAHRSSAGRDGGRWVYKSRLRHFFQRVWKNTDDTYLLHTSPFSTTRFCTTAHSHSFQSTTHKTHTTTFCDTHLFLL